MSRSYRKTSVVGFAGNTEKEDKRLANRKLRRENNARIKEALKDAEDLQEILELLDDVMPVVMKEVSDPWTMAKDGKFYFDPEKFPRLMRK